MLLARAALSLPRQPCCRDANVLDEHTTGESAHWYWHSDLAIWRLPTAPDFPLAYALVIRGKVLSNQPAWGSSVGTLGTQTGIEYSFR